MPAGGENPLFGGFMNPVHQTVVAGAVPEGVALVATGEGAVEGDPVPVQCLPGDPEVFIADGKAHIFQLGGAADQGGGEPRKGETVLIQVIEHVLNGAADVPELHRIGQKIETGVGAGVGAADSELLSGRHLGMADQGDRGPGPHDHRNAGPKHRPDQLLRALGNDNLSDIHHAAAGGVLCLQGRAPWFHYTHKRLRGKMVSEPEKGGVLAKPRGSE